MQQKGAVAFIHLKLVHIPSICRLCLYNNGPEWPTADRLNRHKPKFAPYAITETTREATLCSFLVTREGGRQQQRQGRTKVDAARETVRQL